MYDLISIGNISIDLYFKGSSLTFNKGRFQLAIGGKYFVDYFHTSVGGGGANVAIGASKNELKSAVLGCIGNNSFKNIILEQLKSHSVATSLCSFLDNYINVSSVLLTPNGEKTIIHYSTPHQRIFSSKISMNQYINTGIVYLGNLPDVSLSEREQLLYIYKKNNITNIVNLGINDCRRSKKQLEELLKNIDILIVNGHEFSELVKASYNDIHFSEDVIKWYIPYLSSKKVIITEGEKGSYAYEFGKVYHQKAEPSEKIIDTTGAGDGFTAGFISEFYKSKDLQKSMEKGAKYAVKILTKIGAN